MTTMQFSNNRSGSGVCRYPAVSAITETVAGHSSAGATT